MDNNVTNKTVYQIFRAMGLCSRARRNPRYAQVQNLWKLFDIEVP